MYLSKWIFKDKQGVTIVSEGVVIPHCDVDELIKDQFYINRALKYSKLTQNKADKLVPFKIEIIKKIEP